MERSINVPIRIIGSDLAYTRNVINYTCALCFPCHDKVSAVKKAFSVRQQSTVHS